MRMGNGRRRVLVVGLFLASCVAGVQTLVAAPARWINTGAALEYWTNNANWSASPYPGTASGDSAWLTNAVAAAYAAVLDTTLNATLNALTLANTRGTVQLTVTNGTLSLTTNTVSTGGLLVVDKGGVLTNVNAITVAGGAGAAQLSVTNGGHVCQSVGAVALAIGSASSGNGAVLIAGPSSMLDLGPGTRGLAVGAAVGSTNNHLVVADSAVVTNIGSGSFVGKGSGASLNSLVVRSGGRLYQAGSQINVGSQANNNALTVTGLGSEFRMNATLWVGDADTATGAATGNVVTVDNSGLLTCNGGNIGYKSNSCGNAFIVTNGGQCYNGASSPINLGNASSNNLFVVSGANTLVDMGGRNIVVGSGFGATGNRLQIDNGGVVTNWTSSSSIGSVSGADGNQVVVTNGGRIYLGSTVTMSANSNALIVTGVGSLAKNAGTTTIGAGGTTGNTLTVTAGGFFSGALTVGGGAGANRNLATVSNGGVLQANTLQMTAGGSDNLITNSGGVYEFTVTAPTIAPNGAGAISINSGVISFRGLTGVNVSNNWSGSQLTNIVFGGANAFRLNNSTNSAAAAQRQTYTFVANATPANYAGLELMNGGTAYTNGSVTIGTPTSTNGWLTCSNTTATIWGAVTNYGTLRIVDSAVTFKTNVWLGPGCAVNWASNGVGNTVVVNGTLTVPVAATLTVAVSGLAQDQQLTLFQAAAINGTPAGWSVIPPTYRVASDGTRLFICSRIVGTLFIVR